MLCLFFLLFFLIEEICVCCINLRAGGLFITSSPPTPPHCFAVLALKMLRPSRWNTAHLHRRPRAPALREAFKSHSITHTWMQSQATPDHRAQSSGLERKKYIIIIIDVTAVLTAAVTSHMQISNNQSFYTDDHLDNNSVTELIPNENKIQCLALEGAQVPLLVCIP